MFKRVQRIICEKNLKQLYPADKRAKEARDRAVKSILSGEDNRFLFIVGPCSLDSEDSTFRYLDELKRLDDKVKDKILIIPRLYTAKPRTKGGFMGLLHSPKISNTDFNLGVIACRKILTHCLNNLGFSGADELLYPEIYDYFSDLISYYTIGARSSTNQQHRLFASGIDVAVGIKNPINGDLSYLADSIMLAKSENRVMKDGYDCTTKGNAFAHGILRGYLNNLRCSVSNYGKQDIEEFVKECDKRGLKDIPVIIDLNHDNSKKDYIKQIDILNELKGYIGIIKGVMLESYLYDGNSLEYKTGYSFTDPCLGIEKTKQLILDFYDTISI